MPAFALAFGSFGDILAAVQIVIKLIVLLRDGRRSYEWDETERELKSLGTDLANLTLIPIDDSLQSSLIMLSVAARIKEEVQRCHLTILRFFEKTKASNGLIQKILWAASEERALASFRLRIIERRTALGVVVGMLNSGTLLVVQDRVDQVGLANNQIRDVVHGLAQQLSTYQEQIVALIHHVPHGISEETFFVVSPTGISIPIPLVYCTTYTHLSRILNSYLADRYKPDDSSFVIVDDLISDYLSPKYFCAGMRLKLVHCPTREQFKSWYRSWCANCASTMTCRKPFVRKRIQRAEVGMIFKFLHLQHYNNLRKLYSLSS
ncbi:hypothetical protein B0H19DRAFT_113701 [Mycena capillaripes]|nr:hypothetical protein B0H19DRAFT_113701 [Mycena capillaripes]